MHEASLRRPSRRPRAGRLRPSITALLLVAPAACVALLAGTACGDLDLDALQEGPAGERPDDAGGADGSPPQLPAADATSPTGDAGRDAATACRMLPLDCLDPAPARIIEVPREATLDVALAMARADDVVQVRSASLNGAVVIPDRVTLRGCAGAHLAATASFSGTSGAIEGFVVSGQVVADRSGTFVVRHNRFVEAATPNGEPGVSARADSTTAAVVLDVLVASNRFEKRRRGISGVLSTGPGMRRLTLDVQNNVTSHVREPMTIASGVPSATVTTTIAHNTFVGFDLALFVSGTIDTRTRANLFVDGTTGIDTLGSPYEAFDTMAFQVTDPYFAPPTAGSVTVADPLLVDVAAEDYRLRAGSPAIDAVTSTAAALPEDQAGCPRPAGARSDIGAYERQP